MKEFGLSTFEKLKSRKEIKEVLSLGIEILSADKKTTVKITPAVYKKLGCAVWRNRVKRLIRESYRLNKKELLKKIDQKNLKLKIIFSPQKISEDKNKHVSLMQIMPGMLDLIKKITERI